MRCFSAPRYFAHLPAGHAFPMQKFPASAQQIAESGVARVIDPGMIDTRDLLRVHTAEYVESIRTGRYNELTALRLGLPWHETISIRAHAATAGTLAATLAAFEDGIAANLAGGTHHAFSDRGEGYCVFNDVAIAIRRLQQDEPFMQFMVIDLDAHQGNATNFIFQNDPSVFNLSMHVGKNYPSQKVPGDRDIELDRWITGEVYLDLMKANLPECVERFEPDVVFYNAGVDVHENDRFGQMKLTTEQMRERDAFVIDLCRNWRIPIVVVYGGGYNKTEGYTASLHVQTIRVAAERFASERQK